MINWALFHFLRPQWLLLLIPYIGIIYLLFRKDQVQLQWQKIIAPHLLKHISVGHSDYRSINPTSLSGLLIVIIIIILAGPTWSRQVTPLSQDQSALVIMLDASESMNQSDIQPSRLERSKQKIQDLLKLRQGSHTALIVFAGSAHTVLPLSNDKDILINYLQAIKSSIIPVSGKFPERAFANVRALDTSPEVPLTLLWIGDGFSSQTRNDFKDYFSEHADQLLILGMGQSHTANNKENNASFIPLEETAMQAIAADNNGHYIYATYDAKDVNQINQYIERHFVDVDDDFSPWQEPGYYLIFPLMALFLLWFRKGWTLYWSFFLAMNLLFVTQEPAYSAGNELTVETASETATLEASKIEFWKQQFIGWWLTPNQQGYWLYSQGNYIEAAERFVDPLRKGLSYYQAEQFKLAAEYFSRIDTPQGLFYLANAQAHGQDYLKAIATYDRLLLIEPSATEQSLIKELLKKAQINRDIVRKLSDAINLMSESQRIEEDGAGGSKELGENDPKRAEGAEFKTFKKDELKQYQADEILKDKALHEMWMRNVQPDPSRFLGSKFMMQRDHNKPDSQKEGVQE